MFVYDRTYILHWNFLVTIQELIITWRNVICDNEYTYEEDVRWKVRRAAAKCPPRIRPPLEPPPFIEHQFHDHPRAMLE